ncbi:MAG: Muramidase (flagellum-specific) [Myxococcaceae bacterium]|nr:Muramidase (flagellum-specific) [Myxococcaceae bacterium]
MQVAARKPLPLKPPPSLSSTSQLDRAATARSGRTKQPTRTPGHPTTDSFTPASAGRTQGRANGWREVPAAEAQRMANQGHAVAASWRNQNGPHGHIAIVRPGELGAGGPRIAQAGGTNFNNGSVRQGFGRHTPQYFVHD